MTFSGFALVLAAAFCHATWNILVKRLHAGAELVWLFSGVSAILYFPLTIAIFLIERPEFNTLQVLFIAGSALLHLGYFLLLQTGYRHGDLSLVYPTARATGPLLSIGFATLFLGETLSLQIILGGSIIIGGVLALTKTTKHCVQKPSLSLLFGLSVGMIIASYTVWDAYAVTTLLTPPVLLEYISNVARVLMLMPLAHRRRSLIKQHWHQHRSAVIVIALCNPLAYILVLYAMTFTPIALVAPMREVSVLLAVLAGSLLFGEGQLLSRLGWAAVILGGVSLLATA